MQQQTAQSTPASLRQCALTHQLIHTITICAAVAMGCEQSVISPSETSTALSQITCKSTYGPRQLTSIPTTTRATSFSTTFIEKPLVYSTYCPGTVGTSIETETESQTVIVTETALPLDGIPTSTGIVYVSSTAYETVYETQQYNVTAPAVTVAPTRTLCLRLLVSLPLLRTRSTLARIHLEGIHRPRT
jgi:hypothetical protein